MNDIHRVRHVPYSMRSLCQRVISLPRAITYKPVTSGRTSTQLPTTTCTLYLVGSKQYEESAAMFPYKFAPHSQKKDTNLAGTAFGVPFKRSNLDVTPNATITESTTKRVFDGGFSHSLSSRHAESHTLGGSTYPHHTPEVVDSKPLIHAIVSRSIARFSTSRAYLNGLSVSEHLLGSALSQ